MPTLQTDSQSQLSQTAISQRTRVVITGLGAITPLGNTVDEFWKNLLAGKSGVEKIERFDVNSFDTRFAGQVKGFDPTQFMDRKDARRMSLSAQWAVAAAHMAVTDAHLSLAEIDPDRIGVCLGTALGGFDQVQEGMDVLFHKGWRHLSPFSAGAGMANAAAFHMSLYLGTRGYLGTIVTACASGTQSIGEAAEIIRRGAADIMITGGTDCAVLESVLASFAQMRVLSTRNSQPEHASRPFDRERDGLILSEGSGVLVLESLEVARARGASCYAEVLGSATSADAYHLAHSDPQGRGAARAMTWALANAGTLPKEIDYINAHAASTPVGDAAEVVGIKKVFGERAYEIPISSTKSMIGHSMGAAGALETIVCVLTMRDQIIHPTINYQLPDPSCDLDFVPNVPRPAKVRTVLSNSFGLGGQNACLVLRRIENEAFASNISDVSGIAR